MKIGVIGCGKQAVKHIAGLRKCPDVALVLADKDPSIARALGEREKIAWVETPDQIIADPTVNAVVLCVPTPFHAQLIQQSLVGGKDFFCEKPLCETAEEARALHELAEKARRVGVVGYVYRFVPTIQQARSIVAGAEKDGKSPVLGTITLALMRIGGRGSAALWKHRRADGGGAINEMLVHMLDLAVWFFGPMDRAELIASDVLRPRRIIDGKVESVDGEDFVIARFLSRSGVPVVIEADLLTPAFTQMIEIQGENGSMTVSIQPEMPQFVFTIGAAGGYAAGRTDLSGGSVNLFDVQMARFVTAVRDRDLQLSGTLADSIYVIDALEALKVGV